MSVSPELPRTALCWKVDESASPCYWDLPLPGVEVDSHGIAALSYPSFFSLVSVLVDSLQERVREQLNWRSIATRDTAIPVVIAIPEGPLLPLSVTALHLLCAHPVQVAPNQWCSLALVPLDPSEGHERLLHTLRDVQPRWILSTGTGSDMGKLQKVVAAIDLPAMHTIGQSNLFRSNELDVLDVSSMLRKAIHVEATEAFDWNLKDWNGLNVAARRLPSPPHSEDNRVSHIVYTSGTTGKPKGCISSLWAIKSYLDGKNKMHGISPKANILLASALSFDPCFSDVLATLQAGATLSIAPRSQLLGAMGYILKELKVSHVLCTPTVFGLVEESPRDFPHLECVALGGEPIPQPIQIRWAGKLAATYGVTEACVYQTFGKVHRMDGKRGQGVGAMFDGMTYRICDEAMQDRLEDVDEGNFGEIVLFGSQLDELSGYLNRPEECAAKFVQEVDSSGNVRFCYRTGDRGCWDGPSKSLRVHGRIKGEEGMVKINGVRVELAEVEAAILDSTSQRFPHYVVSSCAVVPKLDETSGSMVALELVAYILVHPASKKLIRNEADFQCKGYVLSGPLVTLIRLRCVSKLRAACIPTRFILVDQFPLSTTGKLDRKQFPRLEECLALDTGSSGRTQLRDFGASGRFLSRIIIECLNLQDCQHDLLFADSTFTTIGGDSLAATRVTRALYAEYKGVHNTRFLGGAYGQLEGPFDALQLLRSPTLGTYVEKLDQYGVSSDASTANATETSVGDTRHGWGEESTAEFDLYNALLQAATLGYIDVAIGLLEIGANPNFGAHGGRLGKISDRRERKVIFRANPLHLACSKGDVRLVRALLTLNTSFRSPDASGLFPLHLAASTCLWKEGDDLQRKAEEEGDRVECVRLLLDSGAPIQMRDGNKQTVLHCAARAGHAKLVAYVMDRFIAENAGSGTTLSCKYYFDWMDHWFRTPVHWAILNGHIDCLEVLLEKGCSPDPPVPKVNQHSSAAVETTLEICKRVYGDETGAGKQIVFLLKSYTKSSYGYRNVHDGMTADARRRDVDDTEGSQDLKDICHHAKDVDTPQGSPDLMATSNGVPRRMR